jgi:hypothetical protein
MGPSGSSGITEDGGAAVGTDKTELVKRPKNPDVFRVIVPGEVGDLREVVGEVRDGEEGFRETDGDVAGVWYPSKPFGKTVLKSLRNR